MDEIITIVKKHLPNDPKVDREIEQMKIDASNNLDFFETHNFVSRLNQVQAIIENVIGDEISQERAAYEIQLTFYAVQLELLASTLLLGNDQEKYERAGLLKQAGMLRKIRDNPLIAVEELNYEELVTRAQGILAHELKYEQNLATFQEALRVLAPRTTTEVQTEFYRQGVELLDTIENLVGSNPQSLGLDGLSRLNNLLSGCSSVMSRPEASGQSEKLKTLAHNVPGNESLEWSLLKAKLQTFSGFNFDQLALVIPRQCIPR